MATKIPDRTAWIPFILFTILAAIVTYSIVKGTNKKKAVQTERESITTNPG